MRRSGLRPLRHLRPGPSQGVNGRGPAHRRPGGEGEGEDLDSFLLQSVTPRVLKGDPRGMHWQFLWQEAQFKTHMRGVLVRVYMNDASTHVEQFQE